MRLFLTVIIKPNINNDSFCKDIVFSNDMYVKCDELRDAIKQLHNNKSCGNDGIYAEHLKYSSSRILPLLCMWFNVFFKSWIST